MAGQNNTGAIGAGLPAIDRSRSATDNSTLASALALSGAGTTVVDKLSNGGFASGLVVELRVTAIAGTSPTLDVQVQDSIDGGTTWNKVASVTGSPVTATGTSVLRLDTRANPTTDLLRVVAILGGTTPTATIGVRVYTIRS